MKRCEPEFMRKSLEVTDALRRTGIEFVAIPVLGDVDREALLGMAYARLTKIFEQAKQDELAEEDDSAGVNRLLESAP